MRNAKKRFIKEFFWDNKWLALFGVITSLTLPLLVLKSADLMKNLIDSATAGDFSAVPLALVKTALFMLAVRVLFLAANLLSDNAVLTVRSGFRHKIISLIAAEDPDTISDNETGDLINLVTRDVDIIIDDIFLNITQNIIFTLMSALSSMVYLIGLHPKLTLIVLALGPLPMLVSMVFQKPVRNVANEVAERNGALLSYVKELFSGIAFIRTSGAFPFFDKRTHMLIKDLQTTQQKEILIKQSSNFINQLIQNSIILAIFGLGSLWTARGELSVGTLIAFIQLLNNLVSPFGMLGGYILSLNRGMVSVQRITDITGNKVGIFRKRADSSAKGIGLSIAFEDVSFSYSGETDILNKVSFSIGAGEKVAIVGANGAGKSTILKLISGLYRNYRGRILIDKEDVKEMDILLLQNCLNVVEQEPYLFSGSILDNIRIVNQDVTDEEISRVLQITGLDPVIDALPNGIHSKIGEAGCNLSGGQRKRLALARALIKDADILLMDEPSLHLDSDYLSILEQLMNVYSGKTIVYVTHDSSLLKYADRVLRVDAGKVSELPGHVEQAT
jgi:ATP-binding cassette subfamily B protein